VADGTPCSGDTGSCQSPSGGTVQGDSVCEDNCTANPGLCVDGSPDGECTQDICTSANGLCVGTVCTGSQVTCATDADCLCANPPLANDCDACCDPTGNGGDTHNCRTGVCTEPPPALTCDPTGQGGVATCQSRDILAIDCQLLGSGAPLPFDVQITPQAVAFVGVPVTIEPLAALALPAALTCSFKSVLPSATVYNSQGNVTITGVNPAAGIDGWSRLDDTTGPVTGVSPHNPVLFEFDVGCGTQAGACQNGFCNNGPVECTSANDCAGTGTGVLVPFTLRTANPAIPDTLDITPASIAPVVFAFGIETIGSVVATDIGVLCLGDLAAGNSAAAGGCAFFCALTDRTGDGQPGGSADSPRTMYDANCDKIGVAACGGLACGGTAGPCPLAALGQTCTAGFCEPVTAGRCSGNTIGSCSISGDDCSLDWDCSPGETCGGNPSAGTCSTGGACLNDAECIIGPGTCVTFACQGGIRNTLACGSDDDCPGEPVCCEPFFDFSGAANVCAFGQPGSPLARTEAPCSAGTAQGTAYCKGRISCGDCPIQTGDAPTAVYNPVPTAGDCGRVTANVCDVPGDGTPNDPPGLNHGADCSQNGDADCTDCPGQNPCQWPTADIGFCSSIPGNQNGRCEGTSGTVRCYSDTDCAGIDNEYCIVPCVSSTCVGGSSAGEVCIRDADCLTCLGGGNAGQNCSTEGAVGGECPGACTAGANGGGACELDTDCPGVCSAGPGGAIIPCNTHTFDICPGQGWGTCINEGACGPESACGTPGVCDQAGCDAADCCDWLTGGATPNFPTASGPTSQTDLGQFPLLPVNP